MVRGDFVVYPDFPSLIVGCNDIWSSEHLDNIGVRHADANLALHGANGHILADSCTLYLCHVLAGSLAPRQRKHGGKPPCRHPKFMSNHLWHLITYFTFVHI